MTVEKVEKVEKASVTGRIVQGEKGLVCLFVGESGADMVELAGWCGFDAVVLDGEHGMVWSDLPALLRAADAARIAPIVRVLSRRPDMISQALDFGAVGVLVPGIQTVEDAKQAIGAARYTPLGRRGLAYSTRAARYGGRTGPQYFSEAHQNQAVWLQVETVGALDCLVELLGLGGLTGVFVGPTDLSMALGEGGALTPTVEAAIQRVASEATDREIPWGIFTPTADGCRRWRQAGAALVGTAVSSLVRPAFQEFLRVGRDERSSQR